MSFVLYPTNRHTKTTSMKPQRTCSSNGVENELKTVNAPQACGRKRFTLFGRMPSVEYISCHQAPRWQMSMIR